MATDYRLGDTRAVLAAMDPGSVHFAMFSPPFLAQRSYLPLDHPHKDREIGSELTPAAFIDTMLDVMAAIRRVLSHYGSVVIEIADTRSGSGGAGGDYLSGGLREGQPKFTGSGVRNRAQLRAPGYGGGANHHDAAKPGTNSRAASGDGWPADKTLCGIPQLLQVALTYGFNPLNQKPSPAGEWLLRTAGIWAKPNPPVGSLGRYNAVTDNGDERCRDGHSYLIEVCTAPNRWTDLYAVRTPGSDNTHQRIADGAEARYDLPSQQRDGNWKTLATNNDANAAGVPPLDWLSLAPAGFPGAHFAVYPVELCRRPIQMLCPRRVCRDCGRPSRRLVEVLGYVDHRTGAPVHKEWLSGELNRMGPTGSNNGALLNAETIGWTTCDCRLPIGIWSEPWFPLVKAWEAARSAARGEKDETKKALLVEAAREKARAIKRAYVGDPEGWHEGDQWMPGIVLDPFGGTGATAIAAEMLGRDAILVDLDESNVELYHDRRVYEYERLARQVSEREYRPRAPKPELPAQEAML